MNREQAKQLLPIIQAFADGADVQVKDGERGWVSRDFYNFNCAHEEYRIKPKPVERWVLVGASGSYLEEPAFSSIESAREAAEKYILCPRIIHMREVTK